MIARTRPRTKISPMAEAHVTTAIGTWAMWSYARTSGHWASSIRVPPTSTVNTVRIMDSDEAREPRWTRAVTSTAVTSSMRMVLR